MTATRLFPLSLSLTKAPPASFDKLRTSDRGDG
jgi:hypothetical protein